MEPDDARRSHDPDQVRAWSVGEKVISRLAQPDRLLVVRHAKRSANLVSELAALGELRWVGCRSCDETMAVPIGMDEPRTCPGGHAGPFVEQRNVEAERVVSQLADAIRRWLSGLPLEAAVSARLNDTHRLVTTVHDPLVRALAEQVRSELQRWPTSVLGELNQLDEQERPVLARTSRTARLVDDLLAATRQNEAQPQEQAVSDQPESGHETTISLRDTRVTFIADDAPTPDVVDELRQWLALDEDDDPARIDTELVNAFAVDALTIAAVHGVVGNFTYDLFPRAAQFVQQFRRTGRRGAADASTVTSVALEHAGRHAADPENLHLTLLEQQQDRSWRASVALTDGGKKRTVKLVISETADVVASKRD